MSALLRVANEDFRLHIHLLKGVAKAALYCAHRTIYMFPPKLLILS